MVKMEEPLEDDDRMQHSYCFSLSELSSPTFDPVTFVQRTSEHVSLEALKADLDRFYKKVDSDLLALINQNYTDFVEISSKLEGMDEKLQKVSQPLEHVKSKGADVLRQTKETLLRLDEMINKLSKTQRRKAFLSSVLRVDALLKKAHTILKRSDSSNNNDSKYNKNSDTADTLTECKTLKRVADMVKKAVKSVSSNEDFKASKIAGKMLQQSSTLEKEILKRLEVLVAIEITPDTYDEFYSNIKTNEKGDKPAPAQTSKIDFVVLSKCFEVYASIGINGIRAAAALLKQLVVGPIIDDTITQGLLDGGSRGSCDGLMSIYERLVKFVKDDCLEILVCANRAINASSAADNSPISNASDPCYLFLDGVWEPILNAIQTNLKPIFSPGIATVFHKNYKISHIFLQDLESIFDSNDPNHVQILEQYRQADITKEFKSKWSVSIYFQVRRREVQSLADDTMKKLSLESNKFTNTVSVIFEKIWSNKVILSPLLSKFLSLHCQVYDSVLKWVNNGIDFMFLRRDTSSGGDGESENIPYSVSPCWRNAAPTDLITFMDDWAIFLKWLGGDFLRGTVIPNIKESMYIQSYDTIAERDSVVSHVCQIVTEATSAAGKAGDNVYARIWEFLSGKCVEDCKKNLALVKGVVKAYRFQKHKALPTAASTYVPKLLQPLKDIIELSKTENAKRPSRGGEIHKYKQNFVRSVFTSFAGRYIAIVEGIVQDVEKSEASLKRLKSKNSNGESSEVSDGDKMKAQLKLDTRYLIDDASMIFKDLDIHDVDASKYLECRTLL